ncbi:DUF2809 domain-containing protein [Polaribacter sp. AHE13PA]|jgi:hypothetical protein|uniref:ribosomal maturation YjgA family protein n=1 Tax=unclassified Polaribacter TaxID=196858 RepID=UPI001C4EFC52|nr:DUF2809 domain-containing protein [Polaribacter sp. AHE13PA]QXP68633.1 DUF2809 domain-containing protein [Polaribacter sp. AHE13PA]
MKIYLNYFIPFILLLIIEVLIERFATGFIRFTIGDYLAVMLVYTLIKSILRISIEKAILITFIIAFSIEFLQLSDLQNNFPAAYSKTLKIILGTSFSFGDLVAYSLGIISIILVERYLKKLKIAF